MFCPRCGQERVSQETSFCSRCGFLLTSVAELLDTGGIPSTMPLPSENPVSPRAKGIRKGIFMFLLMFVIAPIVGLISQFGFGIEPWPIGLVVFGLGVGGLLRIAYAVMFESKVPLSFQRPSLSGAQMETPDRFSDTVKGAVNAVPAQDFVKFPRSHQWKKTNELQPHSVTDPTTKLLEKDRPGDN